LFLTSYLFSYGLSWDSISPKKRLNARTEAKALAKVWRSPYETISEIGHWRRSRSTAHCGLNSSAFALQVGNQLGHFSGFLDCIGEHLQLRFCQKDFRERVPPAFWEGLLVRRDTLSKALLLA
jgi:hypothetical protein